MKQDKQIAKTTPEPLPTVESTAMSVDALSDQIKHIQQIMERVMKKDEHYGTIPGTNKPTLLKPGAEKLCLTFRLNPDYEIIEQARDADFIAYTVKCTLKHINSGNTIASGIGSCNSREAKYRYRWENTGREVPKEYWDNRDCELLGGPNFRPQKVDKAWFVFERRDNTNPWDLDNTLIKMGCKRALIAATLNATAASDIFTQDLEDIAEDHANGKEKQPAAKESAEKATAPNGESSSIQKTGEERRKANEAIQKKMNEYTALVKELNSLGMKPSSKVTSIVNEAIKLGDDWDAKIEYLRDTIAEYRQSNGG